MKKLFRINDIFFFLLMAAAIVFSASCNSTRKSQATAPKPITSQPSTPKPPPPATTTESRKDEVKHLKVALIMPFELETNFKEATDESAEPEVNNASVPAINFYEGAQLAVDSLKSIKKDIKLTAYDTPDDSAGIVRMLTNPAIKETDFVIGTFPNNLVHVATATAKRAEIKLILTQAANPNILDSNKNTALAFASTITQCREMVSFMLNEYPDSKVILVYRSTMREEELAAVYKAEITKLKWSHEFIEFNATDKNVKDLGALLSKTKRNLVFLISSDEAFISPVIGLIDDQNIYGVMLAGLPTWQNFESIDFMALKNTQVVLFDNNFISIDAPERSAFRKTFLSAFQNDPLNTGYNGFDLIFRIGKAYENKQETLHHLLKSAFSSGDPNFSFSDPGMGGIENKSISVLRYHDYSLERINTK